MQEGGLGGDKSQISGSIWLSWGQKAVSVILG